MSSLRPEVTVSGSVPCDLAGHPIVTFSEPRMRTAPALNQRHLELSFVHISPLRSSSESHESVLRSLSAQELLLDDSFRSVTADPEQLSFAPAHLHSTNLERKHDEQADNVAWTYSGPQHEPSNEERWASLWCSDTAVIPNYSRSLTLFAPLYSTRQHVDTTHPPGPASPDHPIAVIQNATTYCPPLDVDDEDSFCDKPYARLIYEALRQAPGHRMMLQEIYDWFRQNTTKPQESGTNGWQNSVRHNLSMNKAFKNEKTDPSNSRGNSKKGSSVWVLTDDAIRNGVQSTTRYRRTGNGKKGSTRTPAPQRQRSGAKGGRAARRAARLRRQEQNIFAGLSSLADRSAHTCAENSGCPSFVLNDFVHEYSTSPLTPPEDRLRTPIYASQLSGYSSVSPTRVKHEHLDSMVYDLHAEELLLSRSSDPFFDEIPILQKESVPTALAP